MCFVQKNQTKHRFSFNDKIVPLYVQASDKIFKEYMPILSDDSFQLINFSVFVVDFQAW